MTKQSTATLPSPQELGFDEKFSVWRGQQEESVDAALHSTKRFVAQALPTGSGKSLGYMSYAAITGLRTCVLTSTKALQSQLMKDFQSAGLVEIKGQNAYQCIKIDEDWGTDSRTIMCDQGPCHFGVDCSLKDGGCLYFDAQRIAAAKKTPLVVTNYAYWLHSHAFSEGLGDFDVLVLDEAHDASAALSGFLSVDIEAYEIEQLLHTKLPFHTESISAWKDWAGNLATDCQDRLDETKDAVRHAYKYADKSVYSILREARDLKRLHRKLRFLSQMRGKWTIEQQKRKLHFEPVWPAPYAEQFLFIDIPKIILTSATIRRKTAQILGIPNKDLDFQEYDSTFPAERRPVIHIPTVRLNHKSDKIELRLWVDRIDKIVRARSDRKGILHTVSYARQKFVIEHSSMTEVMLFNESKNTRSTVEKFKQMEPPALLVSPSIGTGYDFPYEDCQYQIIGKLPFPDTRSAVMRERCKEDKEFQHYFTMMQLVQMCGRGMRAEDDRCESLVIDDNFSWFVWKYKEFAPQWFLEAVRKSNTIPKPIELEV